MTPRCPDGCEKVMTSGIWRCGRIETKVAGLGHKERGSGVQEAYVHALQCV